MDITETTFYSLLSKVAGDIRTMTDESGEALFKSVGTFLGQARGLQFPACAVFPEGDPDEDDGITNVSVRTNYRFNIAFALRIGTSEDDLAQRVLYCREKIKSHFETARYDSISGFEQCNVESGNITPEGEVEGALLMNSGLTVVCRVERNI